MVSAAFVTMAARAMDFDPWAKNYFVRLGVDPRCDDATIKRHYREASRLYHPSRPTGNDRDFQRISEAYEALKTEIARGAYRFEIMDKPRNFEGRDPLPEDHASYASQIRHNDDTARGPAPRGPEFADFAEATESRLQRLRQANHQAITRLKQLHPQVRSENARRYYRHTTRTIHEYLALDARLRKELFAETAKFLAHNSLKREIRKLLVAHADSVREFYAGVLHYDLYLDDVMVLRDAVADIGDDWRKLGFDNHDAAVKGLRDLTDTFFSSNYYARDHVRELMTASYLDEGETRAMFHAFHVWGAADPTVPNSQRWVAGLREWLRGRPAEGSEPFVWQRALDYLEGQYRWHRDEADRVLFQNVLDVLALRVEGDTNLSLRVAAFSQELKSAPHKTGDDAVQTNGSTARWSTLWNQCKSLVQRSMRPFAKAPPKKP